MKSFKQFLNENIKELNYNEFKTWIDSLKLDIRTPKGLKKEHNFLIYLKNFKDTIEQIKKGDPSQFDLNTINHTYSDLLPKIDEINLKFGKKENLPDNIIKNNVAYIKSDAASYENFIGSIETIDKFLKTLSGFHSKPLKNLKIRFVKKTELKGKASYKTLVDELWINLQSMGKTTEEYGSLIYVVLHELGHRYLKKIKSQSWNIDSPEWTTTKYSGVDSWSGEERFAELFALSHWASKYKEYQDKIDKFKRIIE